MYFLSGQAQSPIRKKKSIIIYTHGTTRETENKICMEIFHIIAINKPSTQTTVSISFKLTASHYLLYRVQDHKLNSPRFTAQKHLQTLPSLVWTQTQECSWSTCCRWTLYSGVTLNPMHVSPCSSSSIFQYVLVTHASSTLPKSTLNSSGKVALPLYVPVISVEISVEL